MSKPSWWKRVRDMIAAYPALCEKYADLHGQSLCASYDGMPHGTEPSRATEVIAVRELPPLQQCEYEAVRRAIDATERGRDGADKLRVIKLMYWDSHRYSLHRAAKEIPVVYDTAQNWHAAFFRLVAKYSGFLDEGTNE